MSKLHNGHSIEKIEEAISSLEDLCHWLNGTICRLNDVISLLHNLDINTIADLIRQYEELVYKIEKIIDGNHIAISHLKSLRETYICTCGPVGSFACAETRIAEIEENKALIDLLDLIDDDCKELIETSKAQASDIATSITGASLDVQMSDQEQSALHRKQLADTLRKGEPIAISQIGNTEKSTADAIAALREQLAGGGETMVNSDGTILTPSDSVLVNVGFKPVDKAVVAGGDGEGYIQVPAGKLAGGYGMCRICGTSFNQATNYCPCCGTKTVIEKPLVQIDKVFFSAVAPKSIVKGEYAMIDIFMYEKDFKSVVEEAIANAEKEVKETKSGMIKAGKESNIKVVLSSPDLTIEDNTEEQVWHGEHLDFSFVVELPGDFKKKQILFVAAVYINDVIATRLKFIAKCMVSAEQKMKVIREDVLSAFVSYASQDRNRVAMIIQGMKKARPDMDIFFDVESLRSGDDWENALWHEIDKRDVLFLCWSKSARDSQWVDAEWRYALKQKGPDCIEPVPIDPPGVCPPPKELSKKHFNDKLLYIINNSDYMFGTRTLSLEMDDETARQLKMRLENLF
jgi:hypothetical protein